MKDLYEYKSSLKQQENGRASTSDKVSFNLNRNNTGGSDSADQERSVLFSIWDRVADREKIVKQAWKPVKYQNGYVKEDPNRVFSFSRAFKEMEKLESRHSDIIRTNEQLDQQLINIKEKKSLIEMRAKCCYEYIIKAGKSEFQACGLVALLSEMHQMDFEIQDLPYPNHSIDQKTFDFIIR